MNHQDIYTKDLISLIDIVLYDMDKDKERDAIRDRLNAGAELARAIKKSLRVYADDEED